MRAASAGFRRRDRFRYNDVFSATDGESEARLMHKALAALAAGSTLFLHACATTEPAMPGNTDVVRSVYDAISARDLETFAGLLDPNVEWRLAESEGLPYDVDNPLIGPEAVLAKLGEVGQVLAFEHAVNEMFDAGDVIVATGVYDGLYRPTDTTFTTPFVHVWRVRDGKIIGFEQYVDAAPVVRAAASGP